MLNVSEVMQYLLKKQCTNSKNSVRKQTHLEISNYIFKVYTRVT